jgi:hypothetical protein
VCVGVYPLPYRLPLPVLRRSYAHTAVGTDPGVAGRAAWPVRGTAKGKRPGAGTLPRHFFVTKTNKQTMLQKSAEVQDSRDQSPQRQCEPRARSERTRVCRLRPSVHATRTATPVGFTIYEVYRRLELQESTCIHHPSMFRGRSRIFLNSRAS